MYFFAFRLNLIKNQREEVCNFHEIFKKKSFLFFYIKIYVYKMTKLFSKVEG